MRPLLLSIASLLLSAPAAADPLPYRLLICGVAKNCAHSLPIVRQTAEELAARFQDYAVVVYENNSTDETPQMLRDWMAQNTHVSARCEWFASEELQAQATLFNRRAEPCRYEQIARARNQMLEMARALPNPAFDFVVMADLDIPDQWPIERICQHIQRQDWDVITAFGMDQHGLYYDYFALRDAQWPLGPEFLGDTWFRHRRPRASRPARGRTLIPVLSAFGGLALYRAGAFLPFAFSGRVTPIMEREAQVWLRQLSKDGKLAHDRFIGSTCTLLRYGEWSAPGACCEHVPFFSELRASGWTRCFIDPEMVVRRWGA
jgi:hypothetical protein